MAENTLVDIERDIKELEKDIGWKQAALAEMEAQLKDLNNVRRDLRLEAVGLKHGDMLLVTEDSARMHYIYFGSIATVKHCDSRDSNMVYLHCNGCIEHVSLEGVQQMRQAYLDSVAEAATD